jgi:hypothetical protein
MIHLFSGNISDAYFQALYSLIEIKWRKKNF